MLAVGGVEFTAFGSLFRMIVITKVMHNLRNFSSPGMLVAALSSLFLLAVVPPTHAVSIVVPNFSFRVPCSAERGQ